MWALIRTGVMIFQTNTLSIFPNVIRLYDLNEKTLRKRHSLKQDLTGQPSCHDVKCDITMSVVLSVLWTSASVCECVCGEVRWVVLSVQGEFDGSPVMGPGSPVSVYSSFALSSVQVQKNTHIKQGSQFSCIRSQLKMISYQLQINK